jgi:hypothetical protein
MLRMLKYSNEMVEDRTKYKPEEPDVMSYLLEAGDFFDNPETEKMLLCGDSRLLIVAGSGKLPSKLVLVYTPSPRLAVSELGLLKEDTSSFPRPRQQSSLFSPNPLALLSLSRYDF